MIILRKKEYTVNHGQTLGQVMKHLGLPLEAYLATRDGELITEDITIKDGDEIILIAVISGGGIN